MPSMWDEMLFAGAAEFYVRGRMPYPDGLADALGAELAADGTGVLVDVGAGPGTLALVLAPAFAQVVAVEPDAEMAAHGQRTAVERGIGGVGWQVVPAEEMALPAGAVDAVVFGQSFHWVDRPLVARGLRTALRPGGRLALVAPFTTTPPPWQPLVDRLVVEYLGEVRRAGRRLLPEGTPGDEEQVLAVAGFAGPTRRSVPGGRSVLRDVEDVVAEVYSMSYSAPHLFGDRLGAFDADLKTMLAAEAPFAVEVPTVEIRTWTNPG